MELLAIIAKRLALSAGLGLGLSALGFGLLAIAGEACGLASLVTVLGGILNLFHFLPWAVVVPIESIDAIASPVARTAIMIALPAVDWTLFFLAVLSLKRAAPQDNNAPAEAD